MNLFKGIFLSLEVLDFVVQQVSIPGVGAHLKHRRTNTEKISVRWSEIGAQTGTAVNLLVGVPTDFDFVNGHKGD